MKILAYVTAVVVVMIGALGSPTFAQSYPSRPIKLIAPYPAGSNPDVVGRLLAPALSELLKQPVVVEDRPGAGGMIAGDVVARSAPDGYTLLLGSTGSTVLAPLMLANPQWQWQDVFAPVHSLGVTPVVLHVRPELPLHGVDELLAFARKNPGKLTVADGGLGGIPQLAGELVRLTAKVDWLRVQYTGVPPAIQDVLGGRIDVLFAQVSTTLPLIQSGKLRALATMSSERLKELPDLPTMEEDGFKGLVAEGFTGIFAPARTPTTVVSQLNTAIETVLRDKTVAANLNRVGLIVRDMPSEVFTRYMHSETDKWRRVINEAHLKM